MRYSGLLLLTICLSFCEAVPEEERSSRFGLEHDEVMGQDRGLFEMKLAENQENSRFYEENFLSPSNNTNITVRIWKNDVKLQDNITSRTVNFNLSYHSTVPLAVSYDLESTPTAELANLSFYWLPVSNNSTITIPIHFVIKQIGISHLRVWIRGAGQLSRSEPQSFQFNSTELTNKRYYDALAKTQGEFNTTGILEFPIVVLRQQGVVQLIFRIVVVLSVTIFTFTMGCELDPVILKSYIRKPIGPAIGFLCQFIIMPLVAFGIAKVVPIRPEFGFGLLTMGCSPGGGSSNAWSLLLGGDINLSMLMTFVSVFSALFMMPLILFVFGRFFVDLHRVEIPYGHICIQLLQIAIPALIGLVVRCWKPRVAGLFTKITRPLFLFLILFFLTFGIYANWSIFKLFGAYPIVIPTSALLPWVGFSLAALITFLIRQPKAIVITVALETCIRNAGAAILVLFYSIPQPVGDLSAVMPITVSLSTPIPLGLIYLAIIIRRRCCQKQTQPTDINEREALRTDEDHCAKDEEALNERISEEKISLNASAVPEEESPITKIFGLVQDADKRQAENTNNFKFYEQIFLSPSKNTNITVRIWKKELKLRDDNTNRVVNFNLSYHSKASMSVTYDLEPTPVAELVNRSWYRLQGPDDSTVTIPVHVVATQIGISSLRIWIREADKTEIIEYPIIVLRGKGVIQTIFRIVGVTMVVIFTFSMGCGLDLVILKSYAWKPLGPAIGFLCQFIIMPLVALGIGKAVPIAPEFGFGLLTMGCSPGGGSSNAWSLLLGGDINLSMLMTFVSVFSALFMMPLLLFIFSRFFINLDRIRVPYVSIVIQLLQIVIPAVLGLVLRYWKPDVARKVHKITRLMFLLFLLFIFTFGIYATWSIFKLMAVYPLVIPTGALLPWVGFSLAALITFLLRQPKSTIITVALETGIQNSGASLLILLYSMPQPYGDLGAVMPIVVTLFTPLPLYLILLGITIRRRCFQKEAPPAEIHAMDDLKTDEDNADEYDVVNRKSLNDDISNMYIIHNFDLS